MDDMSPVRDEESPQKVLILQGGGSLGAYECGAYRALKERGLRFDAVAGVSIGAINGAIIAGNPEGRRVEALEAFWEDVSVTLPPNLDDRWRRSTAATYSLLWGNPRLFRPRWLNPWVGMWSLAGWTSLYDTSPMERVVKEYVDFDFLAKKETRLLLTAVNVETGRTELFDSFSEEGITAAHILASGALPPGFPSVTIQGQSYWDGALTGNTPLIDILNCLVSVQELLGQTEMITRQVYYVDLFPNQGTLPKHFGDVLERDKDIRYAARIENDVHQFEVMNEAFALIRELLSHVPDDVANRIKKSPRFLHVLSHTWSVDLVRISHAPEGTQYHFKDYDFSRATIQERIRDGYRDALAELEERAGRPER